MIQSFALAVLALTGLVEVWQIIALAAFQGFINALDVPARQAFLVEMVDDKNDLGNAIALNSSMFNGSPIARPRACRRDPGPIHRQGRARLICFTIDGISYLAVIAALLRMNVKAARPASSERKIWHEMKEGFRYSFRSVPIRAILFLLGIVSIFGSPFNVLMPAFAGEPDFARQCRNVWLAAGRFRGRPDLRLLAAATGTGPFIGPFPRTRPMIGLGRVIAISSGLFAVSIIGFALSRRFGSRWC